ncbi:MFS transporter [Bosea caraganae]|uniref:MFS transporter n=2 Tax=Bosea caraganae TaxID=2763117 RepID=A0A370KZ97_9HYPH|nr:MFS transporter [Bosea caraganae]RDJ24025.1 MFS transporter [Bosea caraganae]
MRTSKVPEETKLQSHQTLTVEAYLDRVPATRFHFVVLGLCFMALAIDGFDSAIIGYMAPALLVEWNITRPELAPVLSAALFGLAIGAIVSGPIADRIGRKPVVMCANGLIALGCLASSYSPNLDVLTVLRFVTGLGLGAAMPNLVTLITEYAPKKNRVLITTAVLCAFPLGASLGGLLAAWLITLIGWRGLFVVGGILPLLVLAIGIFSLPESLHHLVSARKSQQAIRSVVRRISGAHSDVEIAVPPPEAAGRPKAIGVVLSRRYIIGSIALWIAYFMGLVIFYLFTSWMPVLLMGAGFSLESSAAISAMFPFGGVVGILIVGWIMERVEHHLVTVIAYALTAILVFLIGQQTQSPALLTIVILLAGAAMNAGQTALVPLAARFYPTEGRATGIAWMQGIGRTGGIGGALFGAYLSARTPSLKEFFAVACLPGVAGALAIFIKMRANPSGDHR